MSTVIIGAGIVGVSTAYYLSQNQQPPPSSTTTDGQPPPHAAIHLVETTDRLFASASGYAGGFLARDWFMPAAAELGTLSFDQHRALADAYDGRTHWGYAASTALSYGLPEEPGSDGDGDAHHIRERRRGEDWLLQGTSRSTAAPVESSAAAAAAAEASVDNGRLPAWLHRRAGDRVDVLADDGSTAQVDPRLFCQFLLRKAQDSGVQLHQPARVVAVGTSGGGNELTSVIVEKGTQTLTLPCTRLIITAGAWTPRVFETLFPGSPGAAAGDKPLLPVTNYAGHSLVVRSPASTTSNASSSPPPPRCHALFAAGGPLTYCPEIFGRANGTLYMGGLNSSTMPLPPLATDAVPDPAQLDDLLAACRQALGTPLPNIEIVRTGLCHRPATPWGLPIVVRMPDDTLRGANGSSSSSSTRIIRTKAGAAGGVFVAAGHGPWGISMGPGTGMVLAELVQGRPLSADLSGLGLRQ